LRHERQTMSVSVTITKPGNYCLTQDLQQRSALSISEGFQQRGAPDSVVSFHDTHDVDVDMLGHVATTAPFENATGVYVSQRTSNIGEMGKPPDKYGWVYQFPKNLSIHHGRVESPGALEGVGVFLGFNSKAYHFTTGSFTRGYKLQDEDATTYMTQTRSGADPIAFTTPWIYQPATHFKVEKLQVRAGARGVIMTGAENVLRDSVIEVDSDTAVYLYGPGTVVENNTIIVNMKPVRPARLPAVLKLRDADGAVIRNNRLIVRGAVPGADMAGINLLASRGVLIEGNRVEGVPRLLRKDDTSTARVVDVQGSDH
jgi:hypothetical protein